MNALVHDKHFRKVTAIRDRIVGGEVDPEVDDIVAVALDEQREEIGKGEKKIARIKDRLLELQADLEAEEAKDVARRESYRDMQMQAREWKEHGGPLPDALIPACEKAIRKMAAEEAANDRDSVDVEAPDGWEQHDVRSDDDYVYVTFRRARATMTPDAVRKKVAKAIKRVANDYGNSGFEWSKLPWPSNHLRRYVGQIAPQAP